MAKLAKTAFAIAEFAEFAEFSAILNEGNGLEKCENNFLIIFLIFLINFLNGQQQQQQGLIARGTAFSPPIVDHTDVEKFHRISRITGKSANINLFLLQTDNCKLTL